MNTADDEPQPVPERGETETRHEQPPTGSASVDMERRALRVIESALAEPFEQFDPHEYNQQYYGHFVAKSAIHIGELVHSWEAGESTHTSIDLARLRQELTTQGIEQSNEVLENALIYDFMVRKVLPVLLKHKPDDHLRVLDVGGGPSIYQHIPLMGIVDTITHAEYADQNRAAIQQWLDGHTDFSWDDYFLYIAQTLARDAEHFAAATPEVQEKLQTLSTTQPAELAAKLRTVVKYVVPVNVFRDDLGLENDEAYDLVDVARPGDGLLITSNFCIESATPSREDWERGMGNVSAKVAPGGFLLMTAITGATEYQVGNERMPAVSITTDDLTAFLRERDFEILQSSELTGSDKTTVGYDGMALVLARKKTSLA